MKRRYPDAPVAGVGGVVLDRGKVLLVQRGSQPAKGIWSIPGGAVELGETVTEACKREIEEETGIKVEVGPLVKVVDRIHRDETGRVEYHFVLLDYLCKGQGEARAATDAAQARWVPITDIESLGVTADTAAVIREAEKTAKSYGFVC